MSDYDKWLKSVEKNWGSLEEYKKAARNWGASGGRKSTGGGFNDPKLASEAGKKGHRAMIEKLMRERDEASDNV